MAYIISSGVWNSDSHLSTPYIKALDGCSRKARLVDQTPDGGSLITGLASPKVGRPALPDHMPSRARRSGPGVKIYPQLDFHEMGGTPLISQAAKDIIERFEPDTHQFFPVEVTIGKDDKPYGQYYKFFPCNRLDTIHKTLSHPLNEKGFYKGSYAFSSHRKPDDDSRIVLDSDKIGGCHIWQEKFRGLGSASMWMSDALVDAIREASLTGIVFGRVEETKDAD